MITGIADQLSEYCECISNDCSSDGVSEKDVKEIIDLISMYTCWTNEPCDTFLLGERREIIDLPSCLDCEFEFEPFYHPYDIDTFTFTVVKQDGMEIMSEPVEFVYNSATGKFIVDLGLPSCKCKPHKCTPCDPKYQLVVTYQAGYEQLPDCLLPVFCNLLDVIMAKNECDCENDCACDTEPNIKYASGDVVTAALENDLGKALVEQYKKQLALISLCEERSIWGIVV